MKALKKEGLIYLRTEFVELIINGNKYGLYTLQERSMKELIENSKRRESKKTKKINKGRTQINTVRGSKKKSRGRKNLRGRTTRKSF